MQAFSGGGAGFPKIAIAERDCPKETNAYDAPPLKLMYGVIRVATNGILNTENAVEEYV